MLRSSQTIFSPVRAGAALRNNGAVSSSTMVGRTAALAAGRVASSQSRPSHTKAPSRVPPLAFKPPATLPSTRFLVAYSTKSRPPVKYEIDREHEKKVGQELLEKRPGEVTEESSRRHLREPYDNKDGQGSEPPVMNSLKADAESIKETLSLTEVPREVYALGLGGTVPYFLTSLSTVYLGWNLRHSYPTSSPVMNSFMVSHETAHQWLALLEPIQLGFGAVIISFLGAIHWGMEFNEKTPSHDRTRFRYMMGLVAPAIAWPTLFMPVHFALTGQFLAFTVLYFADSRATKMGWVPPWYSTYRFVLTFIVGSAILVSLIFRAKIDDVGENMTERLVKGMHQRGASEEEYTAKWAKLEQADIEKAKKEEEEKKKQEKKEKKNKKKKGEDDKKDKTEEKPKDDDESSDGDSDDKEDADDKSDGENDKSDGDDEKSGDDEEKKDDAGKDDNKDEEKDESKDDQDEKDDKDNKGDGDEDKDSSEDKQKDGNKSDDKTKGDEKKGGVDGDSSSKKKSAKGDEKSKGKK